MRIVTLTKTAFEVGALCLWCIGMTTAVVCLCATLPGSPTEATPSGKPGSSRVMAVAVRRQLDLAVWAGWWLGIAAMLWIGLRT